MSAEQFVVEVIEQKRVAKEHFEMVVEGHPALERTLPGQFVHVAVANPLSHDPLLRRPFSLYRRLDGDRFSMLYRVIGRGTRLLAEMGPGDRIDILGPLGQGFSLEPGMKQPALVGGGVGVPPLFYWAQGVLHGQYPAQAILGFATSDLVICAADFAAMDIPVQLTTIDGTAGRKGLVTEPLAEALAASEIDAVYACGPHPMLAAVAALCKAHGLPAQLALEEWMGCGVGACLSCVVRCHTPEGTAYRRVCKEGPVFRAEEVCFD